MKHISLTFLIFLCIFVIGEKGMSQNTDPLPSWNDTPIKKQIVDFVTSVSLTDSPHYVPPAERIAVFDNDGTLWSERPIYFQAYFVFDRIRDLAPQHPEWNTKEPFASVLDDNMETALAGGKEPFLEMVIATHSGLSTDAFEKIVKDWIVEAKHPVTGRRFTEMIYQPMLELLDFLRASSFKTFIVSGGGIEFLRAWAEDVYGVPPEQVVGSSIKTRYEIRDGQPSIIRLPELDFIDDKEGKPIGINRHIGRRPLIAVGNSDGDFQMLEWTTSGSGPRLGMLVHHTDGDREYAYDRDSHVGRLEKGLDEGPDRGWRIIDMRKDWRIIFPFEL